MLFLKIEVKDPKASCGLAWGRWNTVPGFYGLFAFWGFPSILRRVFLWIIVNSTTMDIGSRLYFLADVRTWRFDVLSERWICNFLINMTVRTILNIYASHGFRLLPLRFVVAERESSSHERGSFYERFWTCFLPKQMRLRVIQPHYTDSCYWSLVSWWKRFMWIIVNILAFTVGYYGDFAFRDRIPIRYRLFPRPCCMTLRKILNMLESASYFLSLNNRMDNWLFDSIRSETSHPLQS